MVNGQFLLDLLSQIQASNLSKQQQILKHIEEMYTERIRRLLMQKQFVMLKVNEYFQQIMKKADDTLIQLTSKSTNSTEMVSSNSNTANFDDDNISLAEDNDDAEKECAPPPPQLPKFDHFSFNSDRIIRTKSKENMLNKDINIKKTAWSPKFKTSTLRQQNGFDFMNEEHVMIARRSIFDERIKKLKKEDTKKYALTQVQLAQFITADIMMDMIQQNAARNGGQCILCDLCQNEIFVLSEKHGNKHGATLHIARFNHLEYHSFANIRHLECGTCNVLRGSYSMSRFLNIVRDALHNKVKGKERLRRLKLKYDDSAIRQEIVKISSKYEENLITEHALVKHLKNIERAQEKKKYYNIVYKHNRTNRRE